MSPQRTVARLARRLLGVREPRSVLRAVAVSPNVPLLAKLWRQRILARPEHFRRVRIPRRIVSRWEDHCK